MVNGNVDNGFNQAGVGMGNSLQFNNATVPTKVTFAIASGDSNVSEITITFKDAADVIVAAANPFLVWLSDASSGAGLTSTSASGTVTAKSASGAAFGALTAKKAFIAQSLATGIFILEITDTAKTGFFVCVQNPVTGEVNVSRVLVGGDYG